MSNVLAVVLILSVVFASWGLLLSIPFVVGALRSLTKFPPRG